MKKFLSIYGRGGVWALKLLAGCTLMGVLCFLFMGKPLLIGGLFVGYFAGAIFCWTLTNRMEDGHFDQKEAASQLQNGLFIRLGSLCVIMGLAAQVSKPFFLVAIAAYLLFLCVAFACLIAARIKKNREDAVS
ncbi:MAG: hypothetical protein J5477_06740 [Schwartzia sp.]|nr:hypothetical protein [Schwartzia sp. (in: firmicutes)]